MTRAGIRYSNMEPDHESSTGSPSTPVSSLPSAYFAPTKGFTRRQVYEAFRE